ncbi:MAG: hypothetical protein V4568_18490 [Pseudomonadota bacterium]
MNKIKSDHFYLSCALALTAALFLVGGQQWAGTVFKGQTHWIAHFVAYAFIAIMYVKGLPRATVLLIGCLVTGIGGLHEVYEITSHGHPFEFNDFLVNSLGAFTGALLARASVGALQTILKT